MKSYPRPIASYDPVDIEGANRELADATAFEAIEWAAEVFSDGLVLSTSFGIQSAVMLHLTTQVLPGIPVIWIDTGYLMAETYRYAEKLREQLRLNLRVFQSPVSPARMEALYGRLWAEEKIDALNRYDRIRKTLPMQAALDELGASAWLAGLRSEQTRHRATLRKVGRAEGRYKLLPILDWTSEMVIAYMEEHRLPFHPLYAKGYASVGDWHSSRPVSPDDHHERDSRFRGVKQECGLHLSLTPEEAASLDSSGL